MWFESLGQYSEIHFLKPSIQSPPSLHFSGYSCPEEVSLERQLAVTAGSWLSNRFGDVLAASYP